MIYLPIHYDDYASYTCQSLASDDHMICLACVCLYLADKCPSFEHRTTRAGGRNHPKTRDAAQARQEQIKCFIPSCDGLTRPHHARRHYEITHGFSYEHGHAMNQFHRRLQEIDQRQILAPDLTALEQSERSDLLFETYVNSETELPVASDLMRNAIMPIALLSALMDGCGRGTLMRDLVSSFSPHVPQQAHVEVRDAVAARNLNFGEVVAQGEAMIAVDCHDASGELRGNTVRGKHLLKDESKSRRWLTVCPICLKAYAVRNLKQHIKNVHGRTAATLDAAFTKACLYKRLVKLTKINVYGQPLSHCVPLDVLEDLRASFERGRIQRIELSIVPRTVETLDPAPGLNSLERRRGKAVVSQAVAYYNTAEFRELYPRLFELLNGFHLTMVQNDLSDKGRTAARRTFKDFLSIMMTWLSEVPPQDRTDMGVPDVLRVLLRAMRTYRRVIGGSLKADTIKGHLYSVGHFATYANHLELTPEQIGNYNVANIRDFVKQQCRILSRDMETFALYETIEERNVRTFIPLQAINRLRRSQLIYEYCTRILRLCNIRQNNQPIPEDLNDVRPSASTALRIRDILITMVGIQTCRRSLEMTTFTMQSFKNPEMVAARSVLYKIRRHKTGKSILCHLRVSGIYAPLLTGYVLFYRPLITLDESAMSPVFPSATSSTTVARTLLVSTVGLITDKVFSKVAGVTGHSRFTLRKYRKFMVTMSRDDAEADLELLREMALVMCHSYNTGNRYYTVGQVSGRFDRVEAYQCSLLDTDGGGPGLGLDVQVDPTLICGSERARHNAPERDELDKEIIADIYSSREARRVQRICRLPFLSDFDSDSEMDDLDVMRDPEHNPARDLNEPHEEEWVGTTPPPGPPSNSGKSGNGHKLKAWLRNAQGTEKADDDAVSALSAETPSVAGTAAGFSIATLSSGGEPSELSVEAPSSASMTLLSVDQPSSIGSTSGHEAEENDTPPVSRRMLLRVRHLFYNQRREIAGNVRDHMQRLRADGGITPGNVHLLSSDVLSLFLGDPVESATVVNYLIRQNKIRLHLS